VVFRFHQRFSFCTIFNNTSISHSNYFVFIHNLFTSIDQRSEVTEGDQSPPEDKVAKKVTFQEDGESTDSKSETERKFYMMEAAKEEAKPNFLVGDEDGFEEIEEKDEFPSGMTNGGLTKQLSDAALMDKRRRLR
jgi:hypothetical protein